MSFKFNYGHGAALAIGLFVIFISYFVYKSLADPKLNHSLVSEEYYKEELYFQDEIDRLENAAKLAQDVKVYKTEAGLNFAFPADFNYKNITGTIKLQRLDDASLDYNVVLSLADLTYLIPNKYLVKGRYNLKLNWDHNGIPYQYKEKINY